MTDFHVALKNAEKSKFQDRKRWLDILTKRKLRVVILVYEVLVYILKAKNILRDKGY